MALAADPRDAADRLRALLPANYALACSPASRCLRLAQLLAPMPHVDARLAEIDFGAWEMRAFEALPRTAIDDWAADPFGFRPPGGETAGEMAQRVLAALEALLHSETPALVILSHAGPLRAIAGTLLGLSATDWIGLQFEYGCVTRIDVNGTGGRIAWLNR